jgi:secreted trypsin-like serine protease
MRFALLLVLAATVAQAEPAPIIGGTATKVGDFPTVVAIEVGQGLCSGTLVTPDWVITAAHCLVPSIVGSTDLPSLVKSIRVVFGSIDVTKTGGKAIGASEVFGDPAFSLSDLGHNDIGLIHLASSYTDTDPTPVNFDAGSAPVGVTVTMVGFGTTVSGNTAAAGSEFTLPGEVSEACNKVPSGQGLPVLSDANVLCFDQSTGKGKCEGDSGGPSFAMIGGVQTLIGTTSFGDQNCALFGVDTRTDAEHDFLVGHVPELDGGGGGGCCDAGHGRGPTTALCAGIVLLALRTRRRSR